MVSGKKIPFYLLIFLCLRNLEIAWQAALFWGCVVLLWSDVGCGNGHRMVWLAADGSFTWLGIEAAEVKWSGSCSVVSDSLLPHGPYGSWNSPSQNTAVGSRSLLLGIFPAQVLNPSLPHCRRILYQLSHKGSPRILEGLAYTFSNRSSWLRNQTGVSYIAGGFFTNWAMREVVSQNHSWGSRELLHCSPSPAWWSQGSYLLYGVWVFLEQMFQENQMELHCLFLPSFGSVVASLSPISLVTSRSLIFKEGAWTPISLWEEE